MTEPLMIRLLSASVAVANRSGNIIREVLKSGQLGVVHKVCGHQLDVYLTHHISREYCSYIIVLLIKRHNTLHIVGLLLVQGYFNVCICDSTHGSGCVNGGGAMAVIVFFAYAGV